LYVPELDRIVLKDATKQRPFASVHSVRKTAITTRVLELVHEVVKRGIHITKRDLFYTGWSRVDTHTLRSKLVLTGHDWQT
jgi:meiotic recombination protein SPO11